MPMPAEQIVHAIKERLHVRWSLRCMEEMAAPICVIAVKQLAGPMFGTPVICTMEEMENAKLGSLLMGIGLKLSKGGQ